MDYLNAAIFGIIQGLTEFLPVSSSGHLVVLHEFIALPIADELTFDVVLHSATLLAVVWFFRREVIQLIGSWIKSLGGRHDNSSRLSWLIIFATIPAGLAGWLLEDFIDSSLRSPMIVALMLILVGILFVIIERVSDMFKDYKNLRWRQALLIGLAQAIALIPGTSRSGITAAAGMGMGLKRQAAIKFSFLLSIPIIAGASIKKIPQIVGASLDGGELAVLLIAFVFAFISGRLAIKFFLRFSVKHTLNIFAVYRFILAAVLIAYFWT